MFSSTSTFHLYISSVHFTDRKRDLLNLPKFYRVSSFPWRAPTGKWSWLTDQSERELYFCYVIITDTDDTYTRFIFQKKANQSTRLQLQVTHEITNNLYKSCSHHRIHKRPCGKRPLLSMARTLAPIRCGGIMSRKKLSLLSVFTIGIKLLISSLITRLVRIGGIILNA